MRAATAHRSARSMVWNGVSVPPQSKTTARGPTDGEPTRAPAALTLGHMSVQEVVTEPVGVEDEEDFGADLSDDELGELLVREITIDGMCGVY
ncbi:MAG: mycofactocin precursor [Chloroflexi bacterium]|nr:MAG: mycofactocin precursor [Chloroflexota bacterium]